MGKQTKYKEEYAEQARIACEDGGFTDLTLARLFHVSKSTVNSWKKTYPKFKEAVQEGKDVFNTAVAEKSLVKRMRGFRYTETTRELTESGKMVVTKKVTKSVPPDTKALKHFLDNRAPERWSNQENLNITGNLNIELVNFGEEGG